MIKKKIQFSYFAPLRGGGRHLFFHVSTIQFSLFRLWVFSLFYYFVHPNGGKKKGDDDITFCQAPFCVFNELSKSPPPFLVHLCERGNARQERNK